MVPGEATIVPLFITVKDLKLIDSYAGMILPSIAGSMNLIIMTTFFKGLPRELIEATEIDGGGKLTVIFQDRYAVIKIHHCNDLYLFLRRKLEQLPVAAALRYE